ncbi:hypothetical protein R5O20_12205 [Tenacibaculum maritimum]|uniref:hypothetical protein n=1 Tax=Tenacibaculum maritimum TaxID=107401 RepID=UPI00388F3BFE
MKILPYYMIDFSAAACLFEIRVNDYPVITQNIAGQVSTYIPINYAILESGKQEVSITMLPLIGETSLHPKAYLKYKVMLFDVTNDFVFKEEFTSFQSEQLAKNHLPVVKQTSYFRATVPYQLNAWQHGINLTSKKDLKNKLLQSCQEIASVIEKKEYSTFEKMILKREQNMATAMYLNQQESSSRITELIQDLKAGFKMMPIPKESVVRILGFGKVAALKKPNGESALYLFNEKTNQELMLDFAFYIPEGKTNFEII